MRKSWLSTDEIFFLTMKLSQNPVLLNALQKTLFALTRSTRYKTWVKNEEPKCIRHLVKIPQILKELHLDSSGRLRIKVNCLNGKIFVTDGLWTPAEIRVFPFSDESADLQNFIAEYQDTKSTAVWAIDLATGCGHTALSAGSNLGVKGTIYGLDINPRALAFAVLNRQLNLIPQQDTTFILNDISRGLPQILLPKGRGLVFANLPFGPDPRSNSMPLTSGGGRYCIDFQVFALRELKKWSVKNKLSFTAYFSGLSYGIHKNNHWQIIDEFRKIETSKKFSWHVLDTVRIPRTNGRRELINPSPLPLALRRFANCKVYVRPGSRSRLKRDYEELISELSAAGWQDLSYGVTAIDFDGEPN